MSTIAAELTITPAELVPDAAVDAVLGAVTEASRCWCRWWMLANAEHALTDPQTRRSALDDDRANGRATGLIAHHNEDAVGWIGVAPRPRYERLPRTKAIASAAGDTDWADDGVWSIVCFTIPRSHRGQGIAHHLLDAAVAHARTRGAHTIEAYPHDTDVSAKPAGSLNTGTLRLLTAHGFTEVGRSGPRVVVRLG